jgi:CRP-like cAMP-binding protein
MVLLRRTAKVDLLGQVPLFESLSKRQLNQVAKHAEAMSMQPGQVLAQEKKLGREFFFIVEGIVQIKRDGKLLNRMSKGDFFGEISLIDGKPRMATVEAETDGTLMVINGKSFRQLLDTVPGLQKKMLAALCSYLRWCEDSLSF